MKHEKSDDAEIADAKTLLRRVYMNFKLNRIPGKYEVFNNHSTYQREIAPLIERYLNLNSK